MGRFRGQRDRRESVLGLHRLIVVWDDWGGEYDNVSPPQLDGQGLGMRVPMLIVSAYDKETSASHPGYISHTQYEDGSVLKFIEHNWNLGSLGTSYVRNQHRRLFRFLPETAPLRSNRKKLQQVVLETLQSVERADRRRPNLGERGIRTLGTLITFSGFQDRRIQPLCHLSALWIRSDWNDFEKRPASGFRPIQTGIFAQVDRTAS